MKAHCNLKEIIWEITDNCHQNCSYCGSKDDINKTKIDDTNIKRIALEITSFPPKEINISGGNPLLVSYETHNYITDIFKSAGIVSKILVNPFNWHIADNITRLYAWKGVSINTESELNELKLYETFFDKTTIITNFNISNLFIFKQIEEFVIRHKMTWQIQYTMYKGYNELGIYFNNDALSYFNSLINNSKANIIKADNMNNGDCSAGKHSLGILANGDVVPCLSMRSWKDKQDVKGNILSKSLAGIWMEDFAIMRCNDFECCKDITKCNEVQILETSLPHILKPEPIKLPELNGVYTYAVTMPQEIKTFPSNPNITMVYGINTNTTDWTKK